MVGDDSSLGREAQIVGDVAESAFRSLAVEAGFGAVKAEPDRTGWDFCVEEMGAPLGQALDLAPAPWRWMVQVKGVTQKDRPISLSLENWRRMATDPLPWFVFVAVVKERRAVEAYLVHINDVLIEQVLGRLRRASVQRPGRLNKLRMSLPWGDDCRLPRLAGGELERALRRAGTGHPAAYQQRKSQVVANVGYSGARQLLRIEVESRHLHQLADFVVGRQGAVPVRALEVQDTRFGVNLSLLSRGPGTLRGPPAPSVGEATVTVMDRLGSTVACAPFEVRHARSVVPQLPADLDRAVLARPHLELVTVSTAGQVNIGFDIEDVSVPRPLSTFGTSAEIVAALLSSEDDGVEVAVSVGGALPLGLKLGAAGTVDPVVRAYVQAFAEGAWVARRAGLSMNSMVVPEKLAMQNTKLAFLRAALAGRPVDWSGSARNGVVLDPGLTGTVAITVVELGDVVFATAVSCVGEAELREGPGEVIVSVKGSRPSLEGEVTMARPEFERRQAALRAHWNGQAEKWLMARGVVNAFHFPGTEGLT